MPAAVEILFSPIDLMGLAVSHFEFHENALNWGFHQFMQTKVSLLWFAGSIRDPYIPYIGLKSGAVLKGGELS